MIGPLRSGACRRRSIPLFALLWALVLTTGLRWWTVQFFTTEPGVPSIFQPNNVGGFDNAIVGTFLIVGWQRSSRCPSGSSRPSSSPSPQSKFATMLRSVAELMTGLPSVLLGVFAYELIVVGGERWGIDFPRVGFSAFAGAVALAMLMIPIIMKASEASLRSVPVAVREAGLALGARKGAVARRVILPTALRGSSPRCCSRPPGPSERPHRCCGASVRPSTTRSRGTPSTQSLRSPCYLPSGEFAVSFERESAWGVPSSSWSSCSL